MPGRLPQLPGELPTEDDWSDHLTTLFPEVRMKRFLEMRGADGGRWRRICALPALWTGLLYDQTSLNAAWDLVKDWSAEERQALRESVPKSALKTPFRRTTVLELARQVLAIAQAGLQRRAFANAKGQDERIFLEPVEAILREGMTPGRRDPAALRARLGPAHRSTVQRLRLLSWRLLGGQSACFPLTSQPARHRLPEIMPRARGASCPSYRRRSKHKSLLACGSN